tara:strand:+ start:7529 stop:7882 length:354 start_codon:yes stop_codon:yes gene_type:complete
VLHHHVVSLCELEGTFMARITIRIDDDLYDALLRRAAIAGVPCATMVRPLLTQLAYPGQASDRLRTPGEEGLAISLRILELLHADMEVRAPDVLRDGIARSKAILRDRQLLDEPDGR